MKIVVRKYLKAATEAGIHSRRAVLFGSQVKGLADEWSDIDLIVIAPELEPPHDNRLIDKLWELRATTPAPQRYLSPNFKFNIAGGASRQFADHFSICIR